MSRWMSNAAKQEGVELDQAQAREIVYGMSYEDWRANHQTEATPEQMEKYKQIGPDQTTE